MLIEHLLKRVEHRGVQISDAAFILSLRTDEKLNLFVSKVSENLGDQEVWIKNYLERNLVQSEFYYILVDRLTGQEVGTSRIYNMDDNSAEWGSWMIKRGSDIRISIESLLFAYHFIFFHLGKKITYLNVRNENKSVLNFHQRYGAQIIKRTDSDTYFQVSKEQFDAIVKKLSFR